MKKYLLLILVICFCKISISACGKKKKEQKNAIVCIENAPTNFELDIPLIPQQNGLWCWAATCTMIYHYYQNNIEQCSIANSMFNIDCCIQREPNWCGRNPACNVGQVATSVFNANNIAFYGQKNLTWEAIVNELYCNKRPIAYEYYLHSNTHINLIVGYYMLSSGEKYIIYNNPLSQCFGKREEITYSNYIGQGYNQPYKSYNNITLKN
jgi:hypothetical protein